MCIISSFREMRYVHLEKLPNSQDTGAKYYLRFLLACDISTLILRVLSGQWLNTIGPGFCSGYRHLGTFDPCASLGVLHRGTRILISQLSGTPRCAEEMPLTFRRSVDGVWIVWHTFMSIISVSTGKPNRFGKWRNRASYSSTYPQSPLRNRWKGVD